jgi:cell division protein ZapA
VTEPATVSIRILDKDYQVHCPPDAQEALQQSAHNLDQRMREIRKSGGVVGLERIAVMAALNLSHDLLTAESRAAKSNAAGDHLQRLDDKITFALRQLKPVDGDG